MYAFCLLIKKGTIFWNAHPGNFHTTFLDGFRTFCRYKANDSVSQKTKTTTKIVGDLFRFCGIFYALKKKQRKEI